MSRQHSLTAHPRLVRAQHYNVFRFSLPLHLCTFRCGTCLAAAGPGEPGYCGGGGGADPAETPRPTG